MRFLIGNWLCRQTVFLTTFPFLLIYLTLRRHQNFIICKSKMHSKLHVRQALSKISRGKTGFQSWRNLGNAVAQCSFTHDTLWRETTAVMGSIINQDIQLIAWQCFLQSSFTQSTQLPLLAKLFFFFFFQEIDLRTYFFYLILFGKA